MRICQISSRHPWNDARIYQRACKGLYNEGFEVHLITTLKYPEPPEEGIHFHWLKKRAGWRQRIFSSSEAYRTARKIDADIYHFHDPDLLLWMLLLSKRHKKIIYDVHENYLERILSLKIPSLLKKMLATVWIHFQNYCILKFSGLITTTITMQNEFSNCNVPKIAINNAPYLRNLDDIKTFTTKTPFTIYTSGSHSDKRNCLQTIEALPLIHKKFPETKVVFAGTYYPKNYDNLLKSKAKALGVESFVSIEGMVPYRENFNRTARMEIGCVFYEDNVNNRATIPNRIFEYMVASVAVIGESFPEVKQIIEDSKCGIVVNSSDPASIAEGVISLFSDIPELKEMQKNGKERFISSYAFDHELKKMISFYELLTAGK